MSIIAVFRTSVEETTTVLVPPRETFLENLRNHHFYLPSNYTTDEKNNLCNLMAEKLANPLADRVVNLEQLNKEIELIPDNDIKQILENSFRLSVSAATVKKCFQNFIWTSISNVVFKPRLFAKEAYKQTQELFSRIDDLLAKQKDGTIAYFIL